MIGLRRRRFRAALAALATLAGGGSAGAQAAAAPMAALPAEAPTSIFAARLGEGSEADAELLVKGSWEAALLSSASLPFGGSTPASFQPLLFTQKPDLFLSFILYDRVFVEARVSEDLSQARYAAGYRGGEGEALTEARVGNDGISFPALPFLTLGGGSYRSFGAKASVKSGGFDGAAMLRYDQAERVTKRYVGGSSVEETTIAAAGYLPGRWFLASAPPLADLALYARSVAGAETGSDGFSYRRLAAGEYSYSAATGAIALAEKSATLIAAAYGGAPADLRISGAACEILYEPAGADGSLAPRRQLLSRYAVAPAERQEAYVRDAASGQRDLGFEARIDPSGYLEVLGADGSKPLRPFEGTMPWIYAQDYSVAAELPYAPSPTKEIVVRKYGAASGIAVDADAIAGSVELRRNGSPEYAFSVDQKTGAVTLAAPASMTEVIELSYLRQSSERRSGSVAAALGGIWSLGPGREAWLGLGTRWAVPGAGFASGRDSNPGSVVLTAGERDAEGALTHRAALAASYGRDEATGRYRIDGMEEAGSSFGATFRPTAASTSDYVAEERAESGLAQSFPALAAATHPDGSAQRALRILAGDSSAGAFYKIEGTLPVASFSTFAFCARVERGFSSAASLAIAVDDGASEALSVTLPAGSISEGWRRYFLRYGSGELAVVAVESEGGPELIIAATSSYDPAVTSAARVSIRVSNLEEGASLWIDELALEDSAGRTALVFQGAAAYAAPSLRLGFAGMDLLSGLSASADASAALREDYYAVGGASLSAALGFARLTARARGGISEGSAPLLRGGHDISFPTFSFPAAAAESFDFDPSTGAFGRSDTLTLKAEDAVAIDLAQRAVWTPPATRADEGVLAQAWSLGLSAAKGALTLSAGAANDARPAEGIPSPAEYPSAWVESFRYYLPAFESESRRRELRLSAALKAGRLGEIAKASFASAAEPGAAGGAERRNEASLRLGLQTRLAGLNLSPFYARTWKERLDGAGGGFAEDLSNLVGDLPGFGLAFSSPPFAELAGPAAPELFSERTGTEGDDEEASYAPEAGLSISREFGSYWWDLVAPSALSLSFSRLLARASDSVADVGTWSFAWKAAAVNLFGADGAYPLGLPFDGDEYLASIRVKAARVAGENFTRYAIDAQHLAAFAAGPSARLDVENRAAAAAEPGKRSWSEGLRASLSARRDSHWLLDLYRLALPKQGSPPGGGAAKASAFSSYLDGFAGARPVVRVGAAFAANARGSASDDEAPPASWKLEESYEAKLTIPERLTATVSAGLSQAWGGGEPFVLGASLGLKIVASF